MKTSLALNTLLTADKTNWISTTTKVKWMKYRIFTAHCVSRFFSSLLSLLRSQCLLHLSSYSTQYMYMHFSLWHNSYRLLSNHRHYQLNRKHTRRYCLSVLGNTVTFGPLLSCQCQNRKRVKWNALTWVRCLWMEKGAWEREKMKI